MFEKMCKVLDILHMRCGYDCDMFEKMCKVLDILHMRCGYDCDMRWSLEDGWTCHVNYIDQGPEFDLDVPLDGHILVQAPIVIASFIIGECQDAIQHCDTWPLEV